MAGVAQPVWQLAHCIHSNEPVSKNGVLDRVFEYLQREQIVRIKLEAVSMVAAPLRC